MTIVTVGIDLAKSVFAVHGVDATAKPAFVHPSVPQAKLLELIASLRPCLIGMEACSGTHRWAPGFAQFGHTVRLMAPKFVIPYRLSGKRGKNDAADAAAICEAVTRATSLPGWACVRAPRSPGGKVMSGKTKRCANRAAQALRLAAAALRSSQSALGAYYRRLCARMDKPKAVTAAAHKLARLIYAMLTHGQEYTDRGQDCFEERYRQRVLHNLAQKAKAMGMQLVPSDNPA